MIGIVYELNVESGRMIYIEPLGDMHIGHAGFDEEKLRRRVSVIEQDEDRYWIGMGDYVDAVSPWRKGDLDRRFSEDVYRSKYPTISEQIEKFIELVEPIKGKCMGLLWGNHEWAKMESGDFVRSFCRPLGVSFLGSRCLICLVAKSGKKKLGSWWIYAIHGSYSGQQKGAAMNKVDRIPRHVDADIYLVAHTHMKGVFPESRAIPVIRNGKVQVIEKDIVFAFTGGFLRQFVWGDDSYMDKSGFPKSIRVGTITVGIDPWERKLHGFD